MCERVRGSLAAEARRRVDEGLALARQAKYAEAEAVLRDAVCIDDRLDAGWAALGMCALLGGEVGQAAAAWRRAVALAPSSPAADWLASLEGGAVGRAVAEYNGALALAQRGDYDAALGQVERVAAAVPGFLPGLRLEGLIHAARGTLGRGNASWSDRASLWAGDPVIAELRLPAHEAPAGQAARRGEPGLRPAVARGASVRRVAVLAGSIAAGAALAAVGFGLGRTTRGPSPAAAPAAVVASAPLTPAPPAAPSPDDGPRRVRGALDAALRADRGALAAAVASAGVDGDGWTAEGRRRALALLRSQAVRDYARGRRELGRGDTTTALALLGAAGEAGAGSYVADDALYTLMLLQDASGHAVNARETARRLLDSFPTSMFANSRTRRLAAAPHPTSAP